MDSTPRELSTGQSSPPTLEELTRRTTRMTIVPHIVGFIVRTAPYEQSREMIVIVNTRTLSVNVIEGGFELETFPGEKLGPLPASRASIEAMPVVKVEEEGKECAICLAELDVGGEAKEMPCKHIYHSSCIEKWLGVRGSCPLCRCGMPIEEAKGLGHDAKNDDREVETETQRELYDDDDDDDEDDLEAGRGVVQEGDAGGRTVIFRIYYAGRRVRRRRRYSETEISPVWNSSQSGDTDDENSGSSA